ncbi:MAG: hypothetical protein IT375_09150 [Polyangiaceae bacterium]|nr:hypothetical protein [Polyangiaceae bacterium]
MRSRSAADDERSENSIESPRRAAIPDETTEQAWPWASADEYLHPHAARLGRRGADVTYVGWWARAFLVTVGSELCVAPWVLDRAEPRGRRLAAVLAANVLSHPAVWFVFPELGLSYTRMLVAAELWAVGSEVLLYRLVFPKLGWPRALAASALANAFSVGAGLLLRALGLEL